MRSLWQPSSFSLLLCPKRLARMSTHKSPSLLCCQQAIRFNGQSSLKTHRLYYQRINRNQYAALSNIMQISEEISDALATNKPIVALESTIYTHGALSEDLGLEKLVRQGGGVPAVIGVLDGIPTVGLTSEQLERLVAGPAQKVSRRDLPYLVGQGITGRKLHGGTTIAGTMLLARAAGIRVFGTGGLGGVHRGWQDSLDISADLTELGKTRVAVVSSGCKGFLDIPRTLEFLETQGVFVSTFADGRSGDVEFPAFWARDSGVKSPYTLQTERDAAAIIQAQEKLGIESGLLMANPIPKEYAIPRSEMEAAIDTAVTEAAKLGFSGAQNTPYVLKRIQELTAERSTSANVALVRSNVSRATKIAVELSNLENSSKLASTSISPGSILSTSVTRDRVTTPAKTSDDEAPRSFPNKADILVAGSVAIDLCCDYSGESISGTTATVSPHLHTSNPATITQSIGGVGYNVALAAHRVSQKTSVRLCSLVGDDIAGHTIISALDATGMDTTGVRQLSPTYHSSARTAQYVAINDKEKNMFVAMADMAIFSKHSFPSFWKSAVAGAKPSWLVIDGNWSESDIIAWLRAGNHSGAKVAFEPVSTAKSTRLFSKQCEGHSALGLWPRTSIDITTPNQMELKAMHAAARENDYFENSSWFEILDSFGMAGSHERMRMVLGNDLVDSGTPQMASQLLPYIPTVITKLGSRGVLLSMALGPDDPRLRSGDEMRHIVARCTSGHPSVGGVYMRHFPSVERVPDVVSVNGVGDTFLGVLVAGLARGGKVDRLIDVAQRAAVYTLRSRESVSEDLGALEKELIAAYSSS